MRIRPQGLAIPLIGVVPSNVQVIPLRQTTMASIISTTSRMKPRAANRPRIVSTPCIEGADGTPGSARPPCGS